MWKRPGIWVFAGALLIYLLLFSRHVLLDITAQVQTILSACAGEVAIPPTALFYILTWLLAFGQCNFTLLMGAAALSMAIFVWAKWWVTQKTIQNWTENTTATQAGLLAAALGLLCSLPTPDCWQYGWYISGQTSPNYWMNGTLSASFPFAILLFVVSYRQLQNPGNWLPMLGLLFLLLISKPSYLFVFACVYPLFLLARHGFKRAILLQLFALAGTMALLLAAEYYLVFINPDSVYVKQFNSGQASGVGIDPFLVWRYWSSNIPLSLLASVTFPLLVTVLWWPELRKNLLFQYSWAGYLAAIAISSLLVQSGAELQAWNFRWQHYIASYILFMVATVWVWEKYRQQKGSLRGPLRWAVLLFGLHLLSGILYLIKMYWSKEYY